jgi:serine phosphatase RsbU (regulator of sigma subunit)
VRAIFRTHPGLHAEPGKTLTTAGALVHDLLPPDLFMTGVYLVLEVGGRVCWAAAGHEPPLRVSPAGQVTPRDLSPVRQPLGIDASEEYPTVSWMLTPGERLVLFTDGLVETHDASGETFGRSRLRAELAALARLPLSAMVRELTARAAAHHGGYDFEDDFTLVGIERWAE